ncbi:MAG: RNA pyrophosphohydrolase [Gammaproteobacteria bacterium]|nr:RNA pyrophosphohydrolase [Gammaproteobacteria bacterium]
MSVTNLTSDNMDHIDTDGYRANVGIIITNDAGRLLLGGRAGHAGWQFPQGGIQVDETPEEALYRELAEEVGLSENDVDVLGVTQSWVKYKLPEKFIRRNSRPLCIGQKQMWYLLRLTSSEDRLRFDTTDRPEFDRWRWVEYWRPVKEVIYFKRRVYVYALNELGPLLFPDGPPPQPLWWPKDWVSAPEV